MISLTTLTAVNNKLEDTFGVESLQNLKTLILSQNQITQLTGISSLNSIEKIYLNNNKIEELDQLGFLLDFAYDTTIQIDNNPILIKYQLKLNPSENHYASLKEILLRQRSSEKGKFTYPIKVLLLGNHAVGKSSLVNYVTNSKEKGSTHILKIKNYWLSISNNRTKIPDVIFFDFGGQDFYHGLYQAFMSRGSFQLIVFAQNKDYNQPAKDISGYDIRNHDRHYWLGQKRYSESKTGLDDPFIMIQTFADKGHLEALPISYLDHPEYRRSFFLSLSDEIANEQNANNKLQALGREYFKIYFETAIAEILELNTREEPQWYIDFLKSILNRKRKSAQPININTLLESYNLENQDDNERYESLQTNLENLHNHGLVLYYNIEELKEFVWPDPEAFVKYVQKDILSKDNFKKDKPGIIKQNEFEEKTDKQILRLLQLQKVIFLHKPYKANPELNEYIIPNYLPLSNKTEAEYQLFTFGLGKPNFILKFNDFIPFGLINQMISFFGRELNAKKFWRDQLLFTLNNEVRVFIQLNFEHQKILVHFQLLDNSKCSEFEVAEYLFFSIIALYWNFSDERIFTFEEYLRFKTIGFSLSEITNSVNTEIIDKPYWWNALHKDDSCFPYDAYVSMDDKRYINYAELMRLEEENYKINSYSLIDGRVNDKDVKEISISLFAFIKNVGAMKNVFISYSHLDTEYLQQLRKFLINLERDGLINIWQDGLIQVGDLWDEKIKDSLEKADICIMLLSQDFIASTYVHKVELKKILEKRNSENCKIIPVLISGCDWKNWKVYPKEVMDKLNEKEQRVYSIASFQFLPKSGAVGLTPVNKLEHQEDAWLQVIETIKEFCETK